MTPEERLRAEEAVVIATAPTGALPGLAISWDGIWAGALVAVGGAVLLTVLGAAIGLSVIQTSPGTTGNTEGWSIATGLWSFFSLVVPLFIGSMIAASFGPIDRPSATVTGTVVWVLVLLATVVLGSLRLSEGPPQVVPAWIAGWSAFGALLLSLLASIAGATTVAARDTRVVAR